MRFMVLSLFLLISCSKNIHLDTAEKQRFEDSWWEIDCAYNECPICFKLNQDQYIETYDLDSKLHVEYGTWSFEEPNKYYWEIDNDEFAVTVTAKGKCWDLKYSIFKFTACRCPETP